MDIVLAEGRSTVRSALRALLDQHGSLRVVGEAADADQVAATLQGLCPDLLLLDWEICRKHSPALLAEWKGLCPGLQIVALSGDPTACPQALAAGACAFVSKGDPPDRLLEAIREGESLLQGATKREA